jgi:hypothetical protein
VHVEFEEIKSISDFDLSMQEGSTLTLAGPSVSHIYVREGVPVGSYLAFTFSAIPRLCFFQPQPRVVHRDKGAKKCSRTYSPPPPFFAMAEKVNILAPCDPWPSSSMTNEDL